MADQYRLYLHPNGVFYHRVKVPADIRHLYGKEIAQRSLRTRDYRCAVRLLPQVIVEFDLEFARLRAVVGDSGAAGLMEQKHDTPTPSQEVVRHEGIDSGVGVISDPRGPMVGFPAELGRRQPEVGSHYFGGPDLPPMSVIAAECFLAVAREKLWSAKTQSTRKMQIDQFIEICGDKPLNRYTQEDIRNLKSTLFALPPRSYGQKIFAGLSKAQVAEKATRLGMPGLSAESVRQIMTSANIVFGWSRSEYDHSLRNIVQPMVPPPSYTGNRRDKRLGFSSQELQRIFKHPVFTGVESERNWLRSGPVQMHQTGRYWVPLLSLFTGTRLMEAVQLSGEDVRCEDQIWFIDINDDGAEQSGKRVKTASSVRRIPIHPILIELGFLDFASTVGRGQRLFSDITVGPSFQRHRHASKLFNRLLESVGVKGPKKVWHSLRHSFEQAYRDSRVDSAIMDQLQGHSPKAMHGVYGDGYGLDALNEGIKSISYRDLDLSHIGAFHICASDPDEVVGMSTRTP
ncbi:site-specific integrase [Neorhizobium sp. T786]|uniref:site-specific integrase n=1 Tax=Pseudorhizobium xiangyangii TaxID=2883104 RepID=UPI001CFFD67F|nr:site-specific integrase [Neorhizobium xiangyangii]MCB5203901.1 site-specific integrase [Neorhizobium xiangyangii]